MSKYFLILFFLIQFNNLLGDSFTSLNVIAESGLNLRSKPDLDSRLLITIPFGAKVQHNFGGEITDTIDGFVDRWLQIEYNGLKGYAWGHFLGNCRFVDTLTTNHDFRILKEGIHCGVIAYSPGFSWYGMYPGNDSLKQIFKPIKIKLLIPKLLTKQKNVATFGFETTDVETIYKIETDQNDTTQFIIGVKENICAGKIDGCLLEADGDYSSYGNSVFLYPEKIEQFYLPNLKMVTFLARDIPLVKDSNAYTLDSRYTIMLKHGYYHNSNFDVQKDRNLNDDLPFMNYPAFIHAQDFNPKIVWYGDIDNDKKLDFIFKSNRGHGWNYSLLLSSKANEFEIIKAVANTLFFGCYG